MDELPRFLEPGERDVTHLARWTASSQKGDMGPEALLDDSSATFWQSDASLPHHLDAQFARVVDVTTIALYANRVEDESYAPEVVEMHVGYGRYALEKISTEVIKGSGKWDRIDLRHDRGSMPLAYLRIIIRRNHRNGKDTRLKGVRIITRTNDKGSRFAQPEVNLVTQMRV